jgi:hypothetical protein
MDAKDILGLPKTPLPLTQEKKSQPKKDSQRKPDGISREVCMYFFLHELILFSPLNLTCGIICRFMHLQVDWLLLCHRLTCRNWNDALHRTRRSSLYSKKNKNITHTHTLFLFKTKGKDGFLEFVFLRIRNYEFQITWQWLPFTSSARKDNLQLYHWVSFEIYIYIYIHTHVRSLLVEKCLWLTCMDYLFIIAG